jgi:23S rRNA (guanosine2251-2'-O)-methyltransferase
MLNYIEGRNPVLEAIKAGRALNKVIIADNIKPQSTIIEIVNLCRNRGISFEYVSREIVDRMSTIHNHQGIIAYASLKGYTTIEDLLEIAKEKHEQPLFCILDGIEDPQNFGAILRTADAAGIHGVIIRSRRAVGITAAVSKASAGAVEYVPVVIVVNIATTIEKLKKLNFWVVGVDMTGEKEFTQVDYTLPTAIVIGGEGKGLSELVKRRCDYLSFIPMKGKMTSLNASIAAALVMYEAFNQRKNA